MKPEQKVYEKLPTGVFIEGIIAKVERDKEHESNFKGEKKIVDSIRFKFAFDGISYQKPSRWMGFNYSEKSNLYKKYLLPLVEGAKPNMDFDLKQLEGMKIKTIWIDDPDPKYQSLQLILPADRKVIPDPQFESEEVPF